MNENYQVFNMKTMAKRINDLTYTDYLYRLMLLSRAIFEWKNLPNNISEKWIERFLYCEGKCVFFKHPELGFMVSKVAPMTQLNHYDEPVNLRPYASNNNFTDIELMNDVDCVIIRNNDEMIPTAPTIQLYAYRLADITRTIDVNINAQKTPVIVRTSDKQKLSLKRTYEQYSGNEPVIFGDKELDTSNMEVLKTDAPIVFDKLQVQKHAIYNECMTFLGINNANQEKKERLVESEVDANDEQVENSLNIFYKTRKEACKRINKIFGTEIEVCVRNKSDIKRMLKESGMDFPELEEEDILND